MRVKKEKWDKEKEKSIRLNLLVDTLNQVETDDNNKDLQSELKLLNEENDELKLFI